MTAPTRTKDVFDYLKLCVSQGREGRRDLLIDPITYLEVGRGAHLFSAYVPNRLGHIRDHFCRPRGLPLINFLVVSKKTGLPGDEVVPGFSKLSKEEKKRIWMAEVNKILAYSWSNVEFIEN